MEERNIESRLEEIKEMAHILGFPIITYGDMGEYRYIKFEDNINPKKRMMTIYARIYHDTVNTEIKFEQNPITFSRDVKMKIKEALDVASVVDGLYDWLNRVVYD